MMCSLVFCKFESKAASLYILYNLNPVTSVKLDLGQETVFDLLNSLGVVTWSSSDENVVKVDGQDAKAYIYAVGPGECTVKASCGTESTTVKVTVGSFMVNSRITMGIGAKINCCEKAHCTA